MKDRGSRGFTLIELFLALAVIGTCLVFIVSALGNLSRFLSQSQVEVEALSLASGKILEWEESLRHGGSADEGSQSGTFKGHPEFEWRSEISPTGIDDSLYEMAIQVFRQGRPAPVGRLAAQGWRKEDKEKLGSET